ALGPFASAAACGKVLGLNAAAMHDALGIAFCRSTTAGNSTVAPSLSKRLGVGFACQSGVVAALLARAGYPASGEVLQGAAGFFQMFYQQEGDYAALLDQLGKRFEIVEVGPKPFPSCRYTHCAVTACVSLLRKHSIKASDICAPWAAGARTRKKRNFAPKAWWTRSSAFLTPSRRLS